MSSISKDAAQGVYGGATESETLRNMASQTGCWRIYSYRNAYQPWWRLAHTDYFRIEEDGDEDALHASSFVKNPVQVYDNGKIRIPRPALSFAIRLGFIIAVLAGVVWGLV